MDVEVVLDRLRRRVQHVHDHLRERPDMTPRERGQVDGARTMAAAVLAMIDTLKAGEAVVDEPQRPVLRLVRDDEPTS